MIFPYKLVSVKDLKEVKNIMISSTLKEEI